MSGQRIIDITLLHPLHVMSVTIISIL